MKKTLLIYYLFIFSICLSQNNNSNERHKNMGTFSTQGCVDLDETIIDLVSIFGDTSLLDGLLGCSEIIPTLESGLLSAFLPFDIPLDCGTDLTPFGYLDMDLSDVCECSCQEYLDIQDLSVPDNKLIKQISIVGQTSNNSPFVVEIYNNGVVKKKLLIE